MSMSDTLYQKLLNVERINDEIKNEIKNFEIAMKEFEGIPGFSYVSIDNVPQVDVFETQKELMSRYEKNQVLYDAILGKQSVEESLQELAQVNKGIRKILPRRKNEIHNERLEQLGQLVSKPYHLKADGVLAPDNFVTGVVGTTILAFASGYVFVKCLLPEIYITPSPEFIVQKTRDYQTLLPTLISLLLSPVMGIAMNTNRFGFMGANLPIEEAKYLDGKVQEFYK